MREGFAGIRLLTDLGGPAELMKSSVKWSFALNNPAILPQTMQRACQLAMSAPRGPVFVSVPTEYTSRALQLVSQKRGQILGYDAKEDWTGWDRISAHIPQAEIHDLIVSLRSLSQGVAFFNWSYDHLNPVPDKQAEAVVAHRQEQLHAS